MSQLPQQLIERQKEALNTFIAVQDSLFSGFEKLVDLNFKAIKSTLGEIAENSQQVAELKDPQEVAAFAAFLAEPRSEKAVAYTKNVYEIISAVSNELAKLTELQVNSTQKFLTEAVEQLSKVAPTGSESAVSLLKSSIASVNSAYDSINKAAKQAAEIAESNIQAATNATLKTGESISKAATSAAKAAVRSK